MLKYKMSPGHSICVCNSQSLILKEPASDGATYAIFRKEGVVALHPVCYKTPPVETAPLGKETTERCRVHLAFPILEVSALFLNPGTGKSDWSFMWLFRVPPGKLWERVLNGKRAFASHTPQPPPHAVVGDASCCERRDSQYYATNSGI
jgi:hypothetical protein